MSVYEFCFLATNSMDDVSIWDIEEEKEVFIGSYEDAKMSKYYNKDVQSFSIDGGIICINI